LHAQETECLGLYRVTHISVSVLRFVVLVKAIKYYNNIHLFYTMKISGALFLLGIVFINANEVFRYEDTEAGLSHYMEGEPGTSVNGGWEFVDPEGANYELNYVADANGYQPQAKHIPVHVDDTEDVKNAKVQFYKMFDETSAKLEALNTKRVEREAVEPVAEAKPEAVEVSGYSEPVEEPSKMVQPSYYAPFYGYFPRKMIPKTKMSKEEVHKIHMEMKDIHEKYIKTRKEKLEMLGKYSPYHYSHFYYYPQHLVPDMKVSEEELKKIQMDLKEADEEYMKEMKEQSDVLAAEFPYYPNFYPKITHFPVKESNDVDVEKETKEEKMLPKFRQFHRNGIPHYYTYSHNKMEENTMMKEEHPMEKKTHMFLKPHHTYSPYYYGYRYPKYEKQEMVNAKAEDVKEEGKEHSRKKRDAPTVPYATYPRLISQSYYPTNALYYPRFAPSQVYHPSVAHVTRTVVNLPNNLIDNAVDSGDDVDVVESQDTAVGSDGASLGIAPEDEPEAEAEAEAEAEMPAEPEAVPENHPAEPETVQENQPEPTAVVSDNGVKLAQANPIFVKRPIYYPTQGLLYPSVANARPAFNPFWATRLNYFPLYPTYGYANGLKQVMNTKTGQNVVQNKYSTFPVEQKDLKLAAIVA